MSRATSGADGLDRRIQQHNSSLVTRAVLSLVALAVLVVLICTAVKGRDGFVGAVLGVALVTVFFGADAVALRLTRRSKPGTIVAVVILLYFVKLMLVLIALQALKDSIEFDAPSLIAAVIIGALATGAAALRLWSTVYVPYVDP